MILVHVPLHIANIISNSTIGMRLLKIRNVFCDSRNHCKKVLKDVRSNYAKTTRRSVASQLNGSRDIWRICSSVLNRRKSTIPPLFGQHLLTKLTSLPGMFPNSFPIFYLVMNRDLALRISLPKWFLVQSTILMHPKLLLLYNKCLAKSCFPSC